MMPNVLTPKPATHWKHLGAALLLVGSLAVPATVGHELSEFLIHPKPFEAPGAPEEHGIPYQSLTLRSQDGVSLDGWLLNPGQERALVFVHGWRSHKAHMMAPYLSWLARRYTVLAFDLRNHGRSGGTATTLGGREKQDVRAATDWLKAHGYRRIGIMGVSMGGALSLVAASADPSLRGVVAEAAFAAPPEITKGFLVGKAWPLKGLWAHATMAMGSLKTGTNWWEASPETAINRLAGRPVLLIHGTADHVILPENATRLIRAARAPKALWWVEGADHVSEPETRPVAVQPEAYRSRVLEFFDRVL